MMYLLFLGTYSYMILFEFRPEIRPLEIVVLLWMGTFIIEELREVSLEIYKKILTIHAQDLVHFGPEIFNMC